LATCILGAQVTHNSVEPAFFAEVTSTDPQ